MTQESVLTKFDVVALMRTRLNYVNRKAHKVDHCKRYIDELQRLLDLLSERVSEVK